jgi:hypothetical protein
MNPLEVPEAVAGGALLFFVPGFAVARAVFPRLRFRGPDGLKGALETVTLSFTLSVVLTVLVGFGLLRLAPGGFAASWPDPLLEASLAAIALVAGVAGWLGGAYSRVPPPLPPPEPGVEGPWEITRQLDRLAARERRLVRALSAAPPGSAANVKLKAELDSVRSEVRSIQERREAEYDR